MYLDYIIQFPGKGLGGALLASMAAAKPKLNVSSLLHLLVRKAEILARALYLSINGTGPERQYGS